MEIHQTVTHHTLFVEGNGLVQLSTLIKPNRETVQTESSVDRENLTAYLGNIAIKANVDVRELQDKFFRHNRISWTTTG